MEKKATAPAPPKPPPVSVSINLVRSTGERVKTVKVDPNCCLDKKGAKR